MFIVSSRKVGCDNGQLNMESNRDRTTGLNTERWLL